MLVACNDCASIPAFMIEFCLSLAPTNQYYSDICLAFSFIASLIILHEACSMTLHINTAWGLPQQINCYHYLLLCIRCMMWGLPQQITNQYFIDVCLTFSFVASLIILQGACPRTLRINIAWGLSIPLHKSNNVIVCS